MYIYIYTYISDDSTEIGYDDGCHPTCWTSEGFCIVIDWQINGEISSLADIGAYDENIQFYCF